MSDLNDLIASNAVRAYNEGLQRGEAFERERIIKILLTNQCDDENHSGECRTFISNVYQYIALIKGESK